MAQKRNKGSKKFYLDRVIWGEDKYVVISFTDTKYQGTIKERRFFDFSGDYVCPISGEWENLKKNRLDFF